MTTASRRARRATPAACCPPAPPAASGSRSRRAAISTRPRASSVRDAVHQQVDQPRLLVAVVQPQRHVRRARPTGCAGRPSTRRPTCERWASTAGCGWSRTSKLAPAELRALAVAADQQRARRRAASRGRAAASSTFTCSGPNPPSVTGPASARRRRGREAAVAARRPLHRRAHRHATLGGEVLAHADLLAVEQHRRAGQREQQAVDHPDAARVAVRASAAAGGAGRGRRSACPGPGRRRRTPPAAPSSVSLSSVSSSWLRTNVAHCDVVRDPRPRRQGLGQRARRRRRASDRYSFCIPMKSNSIVSSSPSVAAEEAPLVRVRQVDLARAGWRRRCGGRGTRAARGGSRAGRARSGRRPRSPAVSRKNGTASTRKPETPSSSQNPMHLGDLVADRRVGDVQVGLVAVEAVQVVLRPPSRRTSRCSSPGRGRRPRAWRPAAACRARRTSRGTATSGSTRAARNHGCWSEVWLTTRSTITRMPAVARGADQLDEVAVRAEARVDAVEVGDVVAVVAVGRRVERHEPQARHAELGEVVDALGQARQVAAAVAVPVQERLDVEAVDDAFFHHRSLVSVILTAARRPRARAATVGRRTTSRNARLLLRRRGGGRRRRSRGRRARCSQAAWRAGSLDDEHRVAHGLGADVLADLRRSASTVSRSQQTGGPNTLLRHWSWAIASAVVVVARVRQVHLQVRPGRGRRRRGRRRAPAAARRAAG